MCNVNPDFAEWAKLPSGCDGGNLRGAIWVCGVEWGGPKCPDQLDFRPDQLDFRKEISELKKGFPERSPEIHKTVMERGSGFDLKASKLISVIARSNPLGSLSDVRNYAQRHITYTANSEFFKLNLFPISFKSMKKGKSDWVSEGWAAKTGCPTRDGYQEWCREYRFAESQAHC